MSILVKPNTKVLVQGITGSFGAKHAQLSIDYGTQIVAGVTPGKGGQFFEHGGKKVPIFDTVADAVKQTGATASAVFVPPPFAADAILEGADAGLELVVAITEGIPVRDMVRVKRAHARQHQDAAHRAELSRRRHARRRQGFARRLPHRHRARLHPQKRPHRRRLAQRHADLRSGLAIDLARRRPDPPASASAAIRSTARRIWTSSNFSTTTPKRTASS